MNYLQNLQIVKNLSREILKPRLFYYSEQIISYKYIKLVQYINTLLNIHYHTFTITNSFHQNLTVSLFHKAKKQQICIIFLHGLGSTRLQGLNLLKQLPLGYSLCLFDFSGNGKSGGDKITYGIKQKQDIQAVIKHLKINQNYKKFVLWGRSMGAVSALLHSEAYPMNNDIIFLVLDSAFCSFQKIAKQTIKKKTNTPSFIINLIIDLIKSNMDKVDYNPFQINFQNKIKCKIPALFIYSESDQVVSYEHSLKIIENYTFKYQKLIIPEKHNSSRNSQTLKIIFHAIQSTYSKCNRSQFRQQLSFSKNRSRGIHILSRQKSKLEQQTEKKYRSDRKSRSSIIDIEYKNVSDSKVFIPQSIGTHQSELSDFIKQNVNESIYKRLLSNKIYL